jgi:tRNA A-37 threonylcarbamoyl transferase component Bud32
MDRDRIPLGYVEFTCGRAHVVCAEPITMAVQHALSDGTLHQYAERHRHARPLAGRGINYAVPLPGDTERVVVRHNRHGGMFASFTADVFLPPTRAPHELRVSERLIEAGVLTPRVLGYAIYPAFGGLVRADVMTREVPDSEDLSMALRSSDSDVREAALRATAALLSALERAGALHHDLNVKNVLLRASRRGGGAFDAFVLDVDRVRLTTGENAAARNLARLVRSARKWQQMHAARVTNAELNQLESFVRGYRDVPAAATLS